MRLVLDTNVLVAAMRSPRGASAKLLSHVHRGEIHAVANVALFAEWEMVLGRPEHRTPQSLTEMDIGQALDELAVRVIAAERHFSWRPELPDPNDEMVLEAAINGQASIIVTFEVRTFKAAAKRYGIAVMTPRQVCAKLKL